jgi:hypothetical protein
LSDCQANVTTYFYSAGCFSSLVNLPFPALYGI